MSWPFDLQEKDCPEPHPSLDGPCMDLGQCASCLSPIGVMRPAGETFGFHAEDCSLPERHEGHCADGGIGHRPDKVRGYWPGMDADITTARERYDQRKPNASPAKP